MCLQGLSVSDLEARMLYQQQSQQSMPHHRQLPPQPHAQKAYNNNSGLYSPSAAAALARLTQSTQQQPQPSSLQSLNRNDPMQHSALASQLQQRQNPPAGPAYANRPGGLL